MIRVQGNETQVITFNGEDGPERACDSYGIDWISLPCFHGFYFFQFKAGGPSKLIKIHLM